MNMILKINPILQTLTYLLLISSQLSAQCIDSTKIADRKRCISDIYKNIFDIAPFYNPVCGCDGVTYDLDWCAIDHGVTSWTPGACSCIDTASYNDTVFQFQTRNLPSQLLIPRNQVCGCNEKTYMSARIAYESGIRIWSAGACSCIDSSVINLEYVDSKCGEFDFIGNGLYNDGRRILKGCDGKFYSNMCEAFYKHGVTKFVSLIDIFNSCLVLPEPERDPDFPCSSQYEPVCGCDNVTYHNQCVAENHFGVMDHYIGECFCRDTAKINTYGTDNWFSVCLSPGFYSRWKPVCGCDSISYINECVAMNLHGVPIYTDGPCSCVDSTFIRPESVCDNSYLDPVCGCDGKVYFNHCTAAYHHGVMSYTPCNCILEEIKDENINCQEITINNPVCGCDGRSYPNTCVAQRKYGVSKYTFGLCEDACKDTAFVINEVPCADIYDPVCGCDNITYTNECIARYKNGVIKWEVGPCTSTSATNIKEDLNILVYPNPTTGKIYLSGISGEKYLITDASGNLVQKGIQQTMLDISHLAPGLYILRLFFEKDSYKSFKVIKI